MAAEQITASDLREREPVDVETVRVLHGYTVYLTFSDGHIRVLSLTPLLHGPVFDEIIARGMFDQVYVDAESGTLTWPNGADLAPEVLRYDDFY